MKKITLTLLSIIFSLQTFSQAPDWLWVKNAGDNYTTEGRSVATDANGNVYATGYFKGPVLTIGSIPLTNIGAGKEIFIAKYDSSGNVLWARSAGGYSDDEGVCTTTDINGNVYVVGYFHSSFCIVGTDTLFNYGMFIIKYDENGNKLWAKDTPGYYDLANGVATDANGNVYVTGEFSGFLVFGSDTLVSDTVSVADLFLLKYDSLGNELWAKGSGGNCHDKGYGISVDASGNICMIGNFYSDTLILGSTILIGNGSLNPYDIFIAKYDSSGNVLWAKKIGGNSTDLAGGITTDGMNNIFITGLCRSSTVSFGSFTLAGVGVFTAKYDPSGNIQWAKKTGNGESLSSISLDVNGNVLITGSFYGSISFGSITLTTPGIFYLFVAKYDASGNALWAKKVGNTQGTHANSISTDFSGSAYVTGWTSDDTLAFDSDTSFKPGGGYYFFLAKLGPQAVGINEPTNASNVSLFPNPATTEVKINFGKAARCNVQLCNTLGECVMSKALTPNPSPAGEGSASIDVSKFVPGIYFITVTDEQGNKIVRKVVKM